MCRFSLLIAKQNQNGSSSVGRSDIQSDVSSAVRSNPASDNWSQIHGMCSGNSSAPFGARGEPRY
jgi:hypothetical protein